MANSITAKIVDYRFIGKTQLNADDMGGVGCSNWEQYLQVCSVLSVAAWNHTIGRSVDDQLVNTAIAGLFDFFGIEVTDSSRYTARILSVLVNRKANRSDALKDAIKARKAAKDAYDAAVAEDKSEDEVKALKTAHENACEVVDTLYREPKNYWFDPAPGFDKKTLKATPTTRKALEDTCADIFTERQFMSADELKAEAQALADQRKGRKMRKKAEAKAAAKAEAEEVDSVQALPHEIAE